MSGAGIPAEAVEAAHDQLDAMGVSVSRKDVEAALEAAGTYLMPATEWGIFRANDDAPDVPTENRRYRTREIAERHLRYDYNMPKFWVVRGRTVGKWEL